MLVSCSVSGSFVSGAAVSCVAGVGALAEFVISARAIPCADAVIARARARARARACAVNNDCAGPSCVANGPVVVEVSVSGAAGVGALAEFPVSARVIPCVDAVIARVCARDRSRARARASAVTYGNAGLSFVVDGHVIDVAIRVPVGDLECLCIEVGVGVRWWCCRFCWWSCRSLCQLLLLCWSR